MRKRPESEHDRLVDRGFRWLRYEQKCRPVFTEMVTGAHTSPDVIGWSGGFEGGRSRLIEVKISRSDFFGDRRKTQASHRMFAMGSLRWYLVPEGLVKPEELPEEWGLLYAGPRSIRVEVPAPERILDPYAHAQESKILMSAIRRLELGAKFFEKTGRWETYYEGQERKWREIAASSKKPSDGT